MNAGIGVDTVDGGSGYDTAILDFSVGDTAEMAGVQGGGNPDGGTWFRPLAADLFNRPDNIYLRNFERVQITGTSKNDSILGTYGDDTLIGGDGNDTLDGNRAGNNHLDGGAGTDQLIGAYPNYNGPGTGGGNDTLLGGPGLDTLFGNHGDDTLMGGDGDDVISAGDRNGFGGYEYGVDVIDAGAGNDVVTDLFPGTNANSGTRLKLDGGADFDTLSANFGNQTQAITFIGGQSNSVEFADGSYLRNFEQLGSFTSGAGHDTFTLPGRADHNLVAGAGNDIVNPGLGIDFADGGAGDDLLILDYSAGDDANVSGVAMDGPYLQRRDINTNALLDRIYALGFERFQMTGGSKDDTFLGGSLADVLTGNAGNDTLSGSAGDDLLDGGAGADTMTGGTGNDFYIVDNPADVINEGAAGGYDTVVFTIGGSLTQPANVEKIIFMESTTLASLVIGPNGVVILGADVVPAPAAGSSVPVPNSILAALVAKSRAASATETAVSAHVGELLTGDPAWREIAQMQAVAGTSPVPIRTANPTAIGEAGFPDLPVSDFATEFDATPGGWLDETAPGPFDFGVLDTIV